MLRAAIKPETVSVIPNAVDATMFVPDPSQRNPDRSRPLIHTPDNLTSIYKQGINLDLHVNSVLYQNNKENYFNSFQNCHKYILAAPVVLRSAK